MKVRFIALIIIGILAGPAILNYMSSATEAGPDEAGDFLKQIYLVERVYYQDNN